MPNVTYNDHTEDTAPADIDSFPFWDTALAAVRRITWANIKTAIASAAMTLTNKVIALGSNTVSGTIAQFNTALTDADFATLAGTESLSEKTLVTPTIVSFVNATHNHEASTGGGTLDEDALALIDVTTNNASTSKHGLMPKLGNDTTKFFRGDGQQAVTPFSMHAAAGAGAFAPADSTTYYFGCFPANDPTTTENRRKIRMPRGGTITRVDVWFNGVNGTSETSVLSIRKNLSTDTTITASLACNNFPFEANITLSLAVVEGDSIEIKWVTPAWTTNPTSVSLSVFIYIS